MKATKKKPTPPWVNDAVEGIEVARAIRDEIRVQLHLASLEAKERFAKLEEKLDNKQLHAKQSVKELIDGLRQLKEQLGNRPPPSER